MTQTALTNEEIARASLCLAETRDALAESAAGLSALQWSFKPIPDVWSIAEVLEHLVLIENGIQGIIGNIGTAPEAPADGDPAPMDNIILTQIPKRSTKAKAPPQICPAHRWTGPEALELFLGTREKTIQLLSVPSLRGHVHTHPIFGPWDGYQWLLATSAHCARHTSQIRELKAEPGFPQTSDNPIASPYLEVSESK